MKMKNESFRVWFTFKDGVGRTKRDFFVVRALNESVAEIKGRTELRRYAYAAEAQFLCVGRYPI
jgi:hypothetical protein